MKVLQLLIIVASAAAALAVSLGAQASSHRPGRGAEIRLARLGF